MAQLGLGPGRWAHLACVLAYLAWALAWVQSSPVQYAMGVGDMDIGDMGVGDMGVGDMGVGDIEYLAPGTWHLVLGTWFTVPGTWYLKI